MELEDDYFLPMEMVGLTCGLVSRAQMNDELEACPTFIVRDEQHWDPTEDTFLRNVSTVVGGKRCSADYFVLSVMDIDTNSYYNKFHYRGYEKVNDIYRAMSQVSTTYSQDLLVDELVSKVNISATYSNTRHHGTDPALLARKWGIGLNRAKYTLNCRTQQNVRYEILPLTRRYRTNLLYQILKRLSTILYTDIDFSEYKSVLGNDCVQIFTDGDGFLVAPPMQSDAHEDLPGGPETQPG